MATTTITARLKLLAEGFKETLRDSGIISNNLENAARSARNINLPRQGSSATSMPGAGTSMRDAQYNAARGTAGATGAAARDFAKQSEGLSGLVRLYATYAANIYAAEAAYRALSQAMDTTNMVKGLNQLGAASGTALGTLSKRLVDATDGAVALRDAMEATVKASSSGMSSEQILRMGKAAKLASQALGVDMNDALSRITRGITKIEPELLDELGIFIKVDDVVKQYSTSVGKAASSITDFEKRQAIANAVLTQAEQKFSAIDIDTNPYTKLAATMRDLAQTGLELVNRVLAPIAGYLSESPTTLSAGMAAFIALILKQALPAIGQIRESILANTKAAAEAGAAKYMAAKKYLDKEVAYEKAAADASAQAAQNRFESLSDGLLAAYSKASSKAQGLAKEVTKIIAKPVTEIDDKDLAVIEKYAEKGSKVSQKYREIADSIIHYRQEHAKYATETARIEAEGNARREQLTQSFVQSNKAQLQDLYSSNIRAQASYIASTDSLGNAIRYATSRYSALRNGAAEVSLQIEELDENGKKVEKTISQTVPAATRLGAGLSVVSGVAAATATKIGGLVSKLGHVGEVVGIVLAVGGLLYAWVSNTGKQASETSKAFDLLESSMDNLSNTMKVIQDKPAQLKFDTASISAASTAISDVADQMKNAFTKAYAEIEAMNWADRLVDAIMPGSVEGDLAEQVSKGLAAALKSIDKNSPAAKAGEQAIRDILRVDPKTTLSAENIGEALDKMSSSQRKVAIENIAKATKDMSKEFQISAARGTELDAAFKQLDTARRSLAMSFVPKDEFVQYGQKLVELSGQLNTALQDPVQQYNALIRLAKEYVNVGSSPDIAIAIQSIANSANSLNNVNLRQINTQEKLTKAEQELNSVLGEERASAILAGNKEILNSLTFDEDNQITSLLRDIRLLKKESQESIDLKVKLQTEIKDAQETIAKAELEIFKTGAATISSALGAEWAKADTTIKNAYASILSGTEAGIKMRAESEKSVVRAQIAQIESQRNLIISNQELALAIERNGLEEWKRNADTSELSRVQKKEQALVLREEELKGVKAGKSTKGIYSDLTSKISSGELSLSELDKSSLQFAQNLEASSASIANLNSQLAAIDIAARDQSISLDFKNRQEALQAELAALKARKESLSTTKEFAGATNLAYIKERQRYELDEQSLAQKTAILALEVNAARYRAAGSAEEAKKVDAKVAELKKTQSLEATTLKINQAQERGLSLLEAQNQETQKQRELFDATSSAQSDKISNSLALLEVGKTTNTLTNQEYLSQKYLLDVQKARLDASIKQETINRSAQDKLDALAKQEVGLKAAQSVRPLTEGEAQALEQIKTKRQEILNLQNLSTTAAESVLATTLETLAITNIYATSSFDPLLEKMGSIKEMLSGFGEGFGAKLVSGIGDSIAAFAELAKATEQNSKAYDYYGKVAEEASAKALEASTPEEALKYSEKMNAAHEKQADIAKKSQKDELAGTAKLLGSAKTLFKEKTAAYKVFNGIEKAAHATSIALEMATIGKKIAGWWVAVAAKAETEAAAAGIEEGAFFAKLPIYLGEIYAKSIGQLGPIAGPVVATGLIAALLAMVGGGSGGSKAPFVPTAEQRQETQGTAFGYDSRGNKVQVREGVLGDREAKSTTVTNLLESIRSTSVEGLSYYDKMVQALLNIRNALEGTSKSLYRLQGLSFGSMFGRPEVSVSKSGIQGLFGSSTSKEITDSGLKLKGTFLELVEGASGVAQAFETIKTTKRSSGFLGIGGGTKVGFSTALKDLTGQAKQEISALFGYGADLIYSLAEQASISADTVKSVISTTNVDEMVSLRGLKGEEFTKQLESVFSAVISDVSETLFASFAQFQQFGEDLTETVGRTIDGNRKVVQTLENNLLPSIETTLSAVGVTVNKALAEGMVEQVISFGSDDIRLASIGITEALVKLSDGLENFLDQAAFYAENFLTEAEQLAPYTRSVAKTFADINVRIPTTRDEFKALVSGLDLTTEAGRSTYQALMSIAPAFVEVMSAAENFNDKLSGLKRSILELTGATAAELNAFDRAIARLEIDPKLLPAQEYVWALEDLKAAEDDLAKARQAEQKTLSDQVNTLKSTVSNLKNFIENIKKFKESLLLNEKLSPLTPAQKYLEAKSQFERIYAQAMGPATTAEEISARDQALSQLESSATSFLNASRDYFGSSDQYAKDFSTVTSALSSSEDILGDQLSAAERSLVTLESQLKALENIDSGILTVAQAIANLAAAQSAADAAKANYNTSSSESDIYKSKGGAYISGGVLYGNQGSSTTLEEAKSSITGYVQAISAGESWASVSALYNVLKNEWGLDSQGVARILGISQKQVLDYFTTAGLPAFAVGTNYVPEDMIAQIHQGERIIPAADNARLMRAVGYSGNNEAAMLEELRKLNKKIEQLERTIAEGDVLNVQATDRNTKEVAKTVQEASSLSAHKETVRRRTSVI